MLRIEKLGWEPNRNIEPRVGGEEEYIVVVMGLCLHFFPTELLWVKL